MKRGAWMLAAAAVAGCGGDAGDGPYAREVARAVPRIEEATKLRFRTPPKLELRSRDQIREFLLASVKEEDAQREIAGQQTAYRRLGAIPETLDLEQLFVETLTEQIAGYYDPKTDVLYIPTDAQSDQAELVVTHELVHALQDQHFNIDSLEKVRGDNDGVTAARAVLEGQATLVSLQLAGQQLVTWELQRERIREAQASMPVFAAAPLIIQETLLFPYLSGADFVGRFYDVHPRDSLFARGALPGSTEQVIHAGAFFDTRDAPTHVTLPVRAGTVVDYESNLGEFETRVLLFQHLRDQGLAARSAAGWDGDRYLVLRPPAGDGIAWLSVWDSPLDAAEFGDALSLMVAKRYPAARSRAAEGATKRYASPERELLVWGGELQGRPVVLYVDMPAGSGRDVVELERVELRQ